MATAKEFFNALDNLEALDFSDPFQKQLYVQNIRGSKDTAAKLAREINFRAGQGVYLFTGQTGSGKSTELQRLKAKLQDEGCSVFYTDLDKWLAHNQPVQLGSFLLAVMASWIEQTGSTHGTRSPMQRLTEFLTKTKINLGGLSVGTDIGLVKTNLQLALSQDPSVIEQVEKTLSANKTSFIAQAHDFIQSLVAEFPAGRKIVLLIDSLEKFKELVASDGDSQDSVLALFQNAQALKLPLVHVVYSISYLVYEQNRHLPAQLGGAIAVNLPSVHIYKHHTSTPDPVGLERMKELLTKRFDKWPEFFTDAQIKSAVEKTGGDLRDFMRVLQVAIVSHDNPNSPRLTDEDLESGYDQVRPSLAIQGEHIEWMSRIQATHKAELEGVINFRVLNRYLETKHVLAYLNGETWYALHPLIQDEVAEIQKIAMQRAKLKA